MSSLTPIFESCAEREKELILGHLKRVIRANETMNLTRIANEGEGLLLHVEDSLAALPEMTAAPSGRYADIGSGAGFPGVPLAIATGRETLLVDSRLKKMQAVQGIVDDLGLGSRISTYAGRAELLARSRPQDFAVVTARALSQLPVLLELAQPLLVKGGHLVCYKAHVEQREMDEANRVGKIVGMKVASDREFVLGEDYTRRIIVFEKVGASKVKLPRQEGQAQKNPL